MHVRAHMVETNIKSIPESPLAGHVLIIHTISSPGMLEHSACYDWYCGELNKDKTIISIFKYNFFSYECWGVVVYKLFVTTWRAGGGLEPRIESANELMVIIVLNPHLPILRY